MAFSLRDLLPFGKKNQDYVGDANAAKEQLNNNDTKIVFIIR